MAALAGVTAVLLDIVLSTIPGWQPSSVPEDVAGWFVQLDVHPLLGLRNLDLLNVVISVLSLPMYLAIGIAQRRTAPRAAGAAGMFLVLGTAVFVANNAALPMLGLSRSYVAASTDSERQALQAAADAVLARGAHATFGALPGFLLIEVGILLIAACMLSGPVFSKLTAWIGITSAVLLTTYTTASTVHPHAGGLIIAVAAPGGLCMMVWNVLIARALLHTTRPRRV